MSWMCTLNSTRFYCSHDLLCCDYMYTLCVQAKVTERFNVRVSGGRSWVAVPPAAQERFACIVSRRKASRKAMRRGVVMLEGFIDLEESASPMGTWIEREERSSIVGLRESKRGRSVCMCTYKKRSLSCTTHQWQTLVSSFNSSFIISPLEQNILPFIVCIGSDAGHRHAER